MYNLSLFVWLHRYSVCFKKKNQENKLKPTAFAISSSAPELFNYNSYLWVMAGHVHLICTVQDHDWGAKYFYLAGCEEKKHLNFL